MHKFWPRSPANRRAIRASVELGRNLAPLGGFVLVTVCYVTLRWLLQFMALCVRSTEFNARGWTRTAFFDPADPMVHVLGCCYVTPELCQLALGILVQRRDTGVEGAAHSQAPISQHRAGVQRTRRGSLVRGMDRTIGLPSIPRAPAVPYNEYLDRRWQAPQVRCGRMLAARSPRTEPAAPCDAGPRFDRPRDRLLEPWGKD